MPTGTARLMNKNPAVKGGGLKSPAFFRKVRLLLLALGILSAAAYLAYQFFLAPKVERKSYAEFYALVGGGQVQSATISGDGIRFSSGGLEYETDNPESPTLKEYLLLNGVELEEEGDPVKAISLLFDIFFYVFFFGVIFIAFRKFISPNTFKVVKHTGVRFEDVVGMDGLKRDMMQVMQILKNPAAFAAKGIRAPKGILLEGAPGNGKTLFAKALAGEADVNFIPAKATDFESMFMAIGPLKVKLLFRKARKRAPCIVFIDEFDGIGTRRNYSGSAIETENTRIVTALLNELDGFEPTKGILVLAATNSVKALDEALIRPGRFDARVSVPYPDEAARKKLVEMYCRGKSHAADCTTEILAKRFNGFSCAKIESVLNRAALLAAQENRGEFTMEDIAKVE